MNITVVTAMRNEGPFVLEWVSYMRSIGVGHIIVYTNDCEDGTDLLLDSLSDFGWLTHIRQSIPDGQSPQWVAFRDAWKQPQVKSADWVLVCDVDEFPQVDIGTGKLQDLIHSVGDCDAIPLVWRLFGNSNIVKFVDQPVTEQFTQCAPQGMCFPVGATFFKTLFRRAAFSGIGIHRPKQKNPAKHGLPIWKTTTGEVLSSSFVKTPKRLSLFGYVNTPALAYMRHYSLKSTEAFLVKQHRGLPNRSSKAVDLTYWVSRNFNTTAIDALKVPVMKWSPQTLELHAKTVQWYRDKVTAITRTVSGYDLFTHLILANGSNSLSEKQARALYSLYQLRDIDEA